MNGDLISRNKLLDSIRNFYKKQTLIFQVASSDFVSGIEKIIEKQPTAYDLDRVLCGLEEAIIPIIDLKMGVKTNGIHQTDDAVLYERAVEIVKSGGKD